MIKFMGKEDKKNQKKEECPLCNVSEETLKRLRGKGQSEELAVKEKPKKSFLKRLLKGKS